MQEINDKRNAGAVAIRKSRMAGLGVLAVAAASLMPLTITRGVMAADEKPAASMPASDVAGTLNLETGKARKFTLDHKIKKANILLPDVADVVPLNPNELLIQAKKPGLTQLIVWDEDDHSQIYDVIVQSDIEVLRKQLVTLFPDSKIVVDSAQGQLILHGRVKTLEIAAQAAAIAAPYSVGAKVQNMLEVAGGQQVMLQVRFAEVSKSAEQQLGINFGGQDGKSFFGNNFGPNTFQTPGGGIPGVIGGPTQVTAQMFGQGAFGNVAFQYFINALQNNNVLRILAEPNLVATSGQEATFLAGGSIPYPVAQASSSGTTITIQWQDYGVNLKFTPIVLGDGRIRLKVSPEVSELDYAHATPVPGTSTVVPALTKRNLDTTVELGEGQTFAVAGLLQNDVTATSSQFPLLGDLPVLGSLFRSVSYQRDETELVVLITPVFVEGMNPADVTQVPGGHWRNPSEMDMFFFHDLGGEARDTAAGPQIEKGPAPRFHGEYGFTPAPGK